MTVKDYSSLVTSKIHKPRDRPLNFHIYGRYKKGKTHFCTTAPKVLILEPEDGADDFKIADPDIYTVEKWEDFDEVYKFLKLGKHDYEYVAFDGMTRFNDMALSFIRSQNIEANLSAKPTQKRIQEYGASGELMRGMLYNFRSLPLGKIYTSQEKSMDAAVHEEDTDSELLGSEDMIFVPQLPDAVRTAVNAIVDVIGRAYTVRRDHPDDFEKKITSYRMWLAPTIYYDTGTRSEHQRALPDYVINPSVERLTKLIKTGSK